MTPVAVLKAARAKIDKSEAWTKGALALDTAGEHTHPRDHDACKWCLVGAVEASSDHDSEWFPALLPVTNAMRDLNAGRPGYYGEFNDHSATTHADVLAVLDRAIELAEGGAK